MRSTTTDGFLLSLLLSPLLVSCSDSNNKTIRMNETSESGGNDGKWRKNQNEEEKAIERERETEKE